MHTCTCVVYVLFNCCRSDTDDEPRGNPLVAGDEDIESDEEEPAVVSVPSLGPTHTPSGGKSLAKGSNKLKAIKDVQLTDSESESAQSVSDSVKQGNRPAKVKMSGEFSFDEPLIPSVAAPLSTAVPEPVRAKETGVGGGLLLSFSPSQQQKPQQQVAEEEAKKGKGKKRKKSKKMAEEEPPQASETLDLDSWLGDDVQGAAVSKVSEPAPGLHGLTCSASYQASIVSLLMMQKWSIRHYL